MSDDDFRFEYNHGRRLRSLMRTELVVAVLSWLALLWLGGAFR